MIRALLCDVEGTLLVAGAPVPGAADAIRRARAGGLAVRFVTNTTTRSQAQVARELRAAGFEPAEGEVFSALGAGREHLRALGIRRALLLTTPAARADFEGIEDDAERGEAVVVGDMLEGWTPALLQRAFERLLAGAPLVALARNRYFRRGGRLLLDAGPYVAALEYASGAAATLVGKPAPEFFRLALSGTGAGASEALVVGDDVEADVAGARAAGMRAALVCTGKFREEDLARLPPEVAVLASVAALDDVL